MQLIFRGSTFLNEVSSAELRPRCSVCHPVPAWKEHCPRFRASMCFYLSLFKDRRCKMVVFDIDHSCPLWYTSYCKSPKDVRSGLCQGKNFPSKSWSGYSSKYSVASLLGKEFQGNGKKSFIQNCTYKMVSYVRENRNILSL